LPCPDDENSVWWEFVILGYVKICLCGFELHTIVTSDTRKTPDFRGAF